MLFQYVGHGEDSPISCDVFDLHFVLNGEPVDVTNEFVIKKLIGNKSFVFEPVLEKPEVAEEQDKHCGIIIIDEPIVKSDTTSSENFLAARRGRPRK